MKKKPAKCSRDHLKMARLYLRRGKDDQRIIRCPECGEGITKKKK